MRRDKKLKALQELDEAYSIGFNYYVFPNVVVVNDPMGEDVLECSTAAQAENRMRLEVRRLKRAGRYEQALADWRNRVDKARARLAQE